MTGGFYREIAPVDSFGKVRIGQGTRAVSGPTRSRAEVPEAPEQPRSVGPRGHARLQDRKPADSHNNHLYPLSFPHAIWYFYH